MFEGVLVKVKLTAANTSTRQSEAVDRLTSSPGASGLEIALKLTIYALHLSQNRELRCMCSATLMLHAGAEHVLCHGHLSQLGTGRIALQNYSYQILTCPVHPCRCWKISVPTCGTARALPQA